MFMKTDRVPTAARRVSEIDWSRWEPVDRATLLFVIRDGEILLIRKKKTPLEKKLHKKINAALMRLLQKRLKKSS